MENACHSRVFTLALASLRGIALASGQITRLLVVGQNEKPRTKLLRFF